MVNRSRRNKRGGMPIEKDISCPEITTLSGHTQKVTSVAFNSDGSLLATGSSDTTAKLWRVNPDGSADQTPVKTLRHSYWVTSVAFNPTGTLLAVCSLYRTVKLWRFSPDGSAVTCVDTLTEQSSYVYSVAFHPTAPLMATGFEDMTTKLWWVRSDGSAATPIATLRGHRDSVHSVAFHPTLPLLATGSFDYTVKLWRVNPDGSAVQTPVATLEGHSHYVLSVAFHQTLPLLATGSSDMTTKLWRFSPDGSTATCVATLAGHSSYVSSVAFHPTAPLLATGSYDQTTKLWHLNPNGSSATCVATLRGHRDFVRSVAFHPTAPLLATGSSDNTVKIWDISKINEYLRRIAITRAGLTSRLIQAFTTENLESRVNLRFSNAAQGRIGNPPNMKYNTIENMAKRDETLRKKYAVFPRGEAVALPPMLASQAVLPLNASAARSATDSELVGIGCVIRSVLGRIEVVSLKPGGPAAKSGLIQPGDVLISVNGVPVESETQAKQLIVGLRGTSIRLQVMRHGEILVFNIVRN